MAFLAEPCKFPHRGCRHMYCLECLKNIFYVAGKEIDLGGGSMYI